MVEQGKGTDPANTASNPADGLIGKFRMEDTTLDPHSMWTRELADQIAQRIAQDVQQHDEGSDKDLINICKSLNSRDDVTATSTVNQALNDLGFPKITVGTSDSSGGNVETEINSKTNGLHTSSNERWWDERTPRTHNSGHDVTVSKKPTIIN